MADGDLAYSHVPADNGALLCEKGGGALLFRKTRTYWKVDVAIHFEIVDDEYYADTVAWLESRMLQGDSEAAAMPYPVAPTGSGEDWALSFRIGAFGQQPPWGPTLQRRGFYKDFGFYDIGGVSTLGDSSTGGYANTFPFAEGWAHHIGRARGTIDFGRDVALASSQGPSGEIILSDSDSNQDRIGINGDYSYGFAGWSLAITLTRLQHHPLCVHAAQ